MFDPRGQLLASVQFFVDDAGELKAVDDAKNLLKVVTPHLADSPLGRIGSELHHPIADFFSLLHRTTSNTPQFMIHQFGTLVIGSSGIVAFAKRSGRCSRLASGRGEILKRPDVSNPATRDDVNRSLPEHIQRRNVAEHFAAGAITDTSLLFQRLNSVFRHR